jgi:hypothetical protein
VTIFGWDQSHFDQPTLGSAVAEGISFVTHKAGGDATDTELPTWWSGVRGLDPAKVLLGAYWVLRPDRGLSAGTQASAFIARLDAACPGWRDRPFMLQADCEKWNNDPRTVPSKNYITIFCEQLAVRMPRLRPIVYAPKWVYGDSLAGLGYPLWASSYVSGSGDFKKLYPGDASSKWAAYSGQTPAILQYTSSATIGGQTTSDANAYRGTLQQLTALVAPGWTQEDDMELTDVVYTAAKGNPGSIAAGPRTLGDILGALDSRTGYLANNEVPALGKQVEALGKALLAAIAGGSTDEDAIVAGVLAGLTPERLGAAFTAAGITPEALSAALPDDLAQQLADVLAQRLAS